MELAVGSLGSLLGSALGKAISGEPKYGFKDVAQTRTTTQLDPKQLQQILDDLTRAEATGRSDIISGAMNAIGMITGDTQYGARQAAITSASQKYINRSIMDKISETINSTNYDTYKPWDREYYRNQDRAIVNSLPRAMSVDKDGKIKIDREGLFNSIKESNPGYGTNLLNVFTDRAMNRLNPILNTRDFQDFVGNTIGQASTVATTSLQQSNPELFSTLNASTNTDVLDPYFRTAQNLNLNALNQMAALNGIRGSDGQVGMTPDQIQANLESTPGYQFRYNQGRQAVERSASARGLLDSGAILKGLTQFGQGLASQEFGANYERLAALAGQTANAALSGASLATTLPQQNRLAAAEIYSGQGNSLSNLSAAMSGARSSALQNSGTNTQKSTSSMLFDINSMTPVLGRK